MFIVLEQRRSIKEHAPHESLRAGLRDAQQRLAADEVALFEIDPRAETDLERVFSRRHVAAVIEHAAFDPPDPVRRSRRKPERSPGFKDTVPDRRAVVGADHKQLEADLGTEAGP